MIAEHLIDMLCNNLISMLEPISNRQLRCGILCHAYVSFVTNTIYRVLRTYARRLWKLQMGVCKCSWK